MRHTRALAPYAVLSLAIVVASAVALVPTIHERAEAPGAPIAAARATLSDTARLAYWRAGADRLELWAGDLDGRRRWTVATAGEHDDPALLRWSPDGASVAYTTGGAGGPLSIAHVDGTRTATILLPDALRGAGWKIVSFEWSPDSTRVAATIRAANGVGNESDVYLAPATDGGTWLRVTSLGDAFAGPWVDRDRLFVESGSGVIAVLDVASRELRPLTGMPAASPLVGRDGRVYFVGGRYASNVVALRPYASGWVWSTTIDGDDLRRETAVAGDQLRLFGMLADGRAAIGVPGGAYFSARQERIVLAFRSGTVRSLDVSGDGRRVIGWTGSRLLAIDPSKVDAAKGALPSEDAARVLVGEVIDAGVWTPRTTPELAHVRPQSSAAPRARLAYVLGRTVWGSAADGSVRQIAAGPQYYISQPRWSPSGDRLAVVVTEGAPARASAIVTGEGGTVRWDAPSLYPAFRWTLDGNALAFTTGGGIADRGAGPEPIPLITEVRDAATGSLLERLPGRVVWTPAGPVTLTDGERPPGPSAHPIFVRQRVEVAGPAGPRIVTDAALLASQVLTAGNVPFDPVITEVLPFGDPSYLAVQVWKQTANAMADGALVVVRVRDGRAVWSLPMNNQSGPTYTSDISASPAGRYVAWTEFERIEATNRRAFVADPLTGRGVLAVDGRFGGWSPDPDWVYVARDEGLFAVRLDGSAEVRVSLIGVPVVAARP